ncbi:type II toxin-antitoxin system VapC family toxin [Brevundimonas sp.]|uniref:type II toxin-antitoxin system VapC family toxin n=1 Tax=Brevundimonas sp. TaxID=1871086 RepID=UPI0037BF0A0B
MIDYCDASVVVPYLMAERHSEAVIAFMADGDRSLQISDFVVAEVSSAVSRLVRMRKLTVDDADGVLHDLDDWIDTTTPPIEVEGADVRESVLLVRQFDLKLGAPDGLHIAICRRIEARLITLDNNLAAAAHAVGLPCINPAESSAV